VTITELPAMMQICMFVVVGVVSTIQGVELGVELWNSRNLKLACWIGVSQR